MLAEICRRGHTEMDVARWHGALSDRLDADALGGLYADLVERMIAIR